jgi:cobyrinic acid a,c-diamide synthase
LTGTASCPAVLIAAPASGQGKTTVAAALARLHTRAGRRVRAFKCGPDFLDPFWLATATGAPVDALDLWMTGEVDCAARLFAAARYADLVIVEGAMGLFDGTPSAADIASRFGLPVLAVVDAHAMAGTFGAMAFGLRHYREGLPWAGVLANRVASERHALVLRDGLRDPGDWLGALPRSAAWALPERHLGLASDLPAADALARLDAAADALADTPLGRMGLAALASWAVEFSPAAAMNDAALARQPLRGKHIAVARDAGFCFIYSANLDCLLALGATLDFFSPLANQPLPPCDAVWLPGGYPELHLPALALATETRRGVAAHIAAGRPVWAECGGMMALMESIVDTAGYRHPAWGLLPGSTTMQKRLAALGPQQLELPAGILRGHTFHYSTATTALQSTARTARPGVAPAADAGEAVYRQGPVRASYFHAWFPSSPGAAASLFGGGA